VNISRLTDACSVSQQIAPQDVAEIARLGYKAIVCNRPDGEDFGQPTAASISVECEANGIAFHNIPISKPGLNAGMIEQFRDIVANSGGPVLAYCRSGQRSAVLWQASGGP